MSHLALMPSACQDDGPRSERGFPGPAKRGRGRPRLSEAEKSERKAEREAKRAEGRVVAPPLSAEERFAVLVEHTPLVVEAQAVASTAADNVKAAKKRLKKALGVGVDAANELALFQRLQTKEGQAELRGALEMLTRLSLWKTRLRSGANETETPMPADAVDWRARGAQAFAEGRNNFVPADVPEGEAINFLDGYWQASLGLNAVGGE